MFTSHIRYVHGVDFSGAENAGRRIWIATGIIQEKTLEIRGIRPAKELPLSGTKREECLRALVDFISQEREAIIGLDFPFGLPSRLVRQNNWEDFVFSLRRMYCDSERFRRVCFNSAKRRELKRITDKEQKTPFSPYNLRLFKQTYHGIRDVIDPLLRKGECCFVPMQKPMFGKTWIIEICPAVTLNEENLYSPYKGKTPEHYGSRVRILKGLEEIGCLSISRDLKTKVLGDSKGDAIDSVVAAVTTFRVFRSGTLLSASKNDARTIEGYVYP